MQIKFCGAAQEVTGSAHLLLLDNGKKILLDFGLYQGGDAEMRNFNREFMFDPKEIDYVILSHAHIDHSGRIPFLVRNGFTGNIFATHATTNLCSIMLLDSAHIQESDAKYSNDKSKSKPGDKDWVEPLYTKEDVPVAMSRFVSISYNNWMKIDDDITLVFRDAGHILGSASVTLKIKENGEEIMFGFTGDIGRPDRPILRDPRQMPEVDYLLMESTYGNRNHESRPIEKERLLDVIHDTCVKNQGKLIIPAFSIGRTQEVVYLMDQLESEGKLPKLPIFVDSPLAIDATEIYGSHPECFDEELSSYILKDPNPFGFKNLSYVREVAGSKALNTYDKPCVIISASGMMTAGRVRHHLFNNVDNPRNTFLFLGYSSPGTPAQMLQSGISEIKMFGEVKKVRARMMKIEGFSAHGDRDEMIDFISNQKNLKKLFLVHGEAKTQFEFKEYLKEKGYKNVYIPKIGDIQSVN